MRSVILASLAAAALTTVAPAAFAQGQNYYPYDYYGRGYQYDYRGYHSDRGYYNNGVDIRAIRDKCENDWRRAQYKGNTGGKPYNVYIRQCVDRDASASAYQNDRDRYYNNNYNNYDYYRRR
jgi:hypothetical protein